MSVVGLQVDMGGSMGEGLPGLGGDGGKVKTTAGGGAGTQASIAACERGEAGGDFGYVHGIQANKDRGAAVVVWVGLWYHGFM